MEKERYRILKKLAEGGSGISYLVWDKRLERNWVMKCILLDEAWQQEAAEREISALKHIHKEGIPVLADVFYEQDRICLIMEYMDGISLEEKIKREGAMEEAEAIDCALQIAGLVYFLHTLSPGLLHGDLKPLNLIYHKKRIALLDFGGAAFAGAGSGRAAAGICYTPGYGAPELAGGGRISERSDIYAFGAVLFYLVTGDAPGSSRGIYPVREQKAYLSARLERLIRKCTESEPEKRYASMGEIIRELQGIADTHFLTGGKKGGLAGRKKHARRMFQCVRSILLTEGGDGNGTIAGRIGRTVFVLFAGILWGRAISLQAAGDLLPVSICTKAGEKLLVDFGAVYHTEENPVFELPLKCFEAGKEYEVTIRQREKQSGSVRERTFVVCAD